MDITKFLRGGGRLGNFLAVGEIVPMESPMLCASSRWAAGAAVCGCIACWLVLYHSVTQFYVFVVCRYAASDLVTPVTSVYLYCCQPFWSLQLLLMVYIRCAYCMVMFSRYLSRCNHRCDKTILRFLVLVKTVKMRLFTFLKFCQRFWPTVRAPLVSNVVCRLSVWRLWRFVLWRNGTS